MPRTNFPFFIFHFAFFILIFYVLFSIFHFFIFYFSFFIFYLFIFIFIFIFYFLFFIFYFLFFILWKFIIYKFITLIVISSHWTALEEKISNNSSTIVESINQSMCKTRVKSWLLSGNPVCYAYFLRWFWRAGELSRHRRAMSTRKGLMNSSMSNFNAWIPYRTKKNIP